jgi:sterol desaturase/sphingolipid hydroxylase (fatty acid hydroxylase superfamily)
MPDYPEPTIYAIPMFLVTLLGEMWILRKWRREKRDVIGYERRDTWASLAMGLGSLFFVFFINWGIFAITKWTWAHRVIDVGHGALGWTVAILGWDLSFYLYHRVEHENRFLWACHVNHHSSQHYNLSTALRQPWTPYMGLVFFPVWGFVGVEPRMVMISGGINLVYQYWVHTEAIGKLPAPIEWIMNTPSHHRVHHGSNPEYLDKNYAGIFIIWDRMFGTFEPERARVRFGLTKNIDSFNPFYIAFHEYWAIAKDVARARSWRTRLGILWHGPAWHPPTPADAE